MATLSCGSSLRDLHRSPELEIHIHPEGIEFEAATVDGIIKLYDIEIHYHPRKANVVADALSRKPCTLNALIQAEHPELFKEFEDFRLELVSHGYLATMELAPTLTDQIKEA